MPETLVVEVNFRKKESCKLLKIIKIKNRPYYGINSPRKAGNLLRLITYNIRLTFENQEEKQRLLLTLEGQRHAFNEASKIHFGKGGKRVNSIVELHAKFYKKFRLANPNLIADFVSAAENECLASYRTVKSNKHKISSPIEKKRLSCRLNKNLFVFDLSNSRIKLSCVGGRRIWCGLKLYDKAQSLFQQYRACDPLIFERNGDFWLAVTFDNPPIGINSPEKAIGIDLGIRRIISTSDGKIYQDKKYLKEKRYLRYLKRELQRSKSLGSKSARRHLKKLRRKEANKTKNFCHHLANAILRSNANVIVIEDLAKIKERKGKNKYKNMNKISQVPFYMIKQFLTYKAPMHGKRVEVICPRDTSRIDFRTGVKDGERKGCRYYGKDGVVLDADLNAANNIVLKSKHPDSCKVMSQALDGQAIVTSPIVGCLRPDKFLD